MLYHKAFPMIPLPLIPVEAIIDITIVDVLNFQKFPCIKITKLGFMGNCKFFKILAIAKFWQYLSPFDKLNAYTTRKTGYVRFLKHLFCSIFTNTRKTSTKMTNYPKPTVAAAMTAATPPSTAAMTASKQQTGVPTRINE